MVAPLYPWALILRNEMEDNRAVVRFTIDMPKEIHKRFKSICALKGVPMSWMVSSLVVVFINDPVIHDEDIEVGES